VSSHSDDVIAATLFAEQEIAALDEPGGSSLDVSGSDRVTHLLGPRFGDAR
jgi:energy-coupling factor transporter ATP-binding protein EcfA2